MLPDGTILYHGSYASVSQIDLSRCAPGKDFGRGFYLTSSGDQARRFIAASLRKARAIGRVPEDRRHGFVSEFRLASLDGLSVYEFPRADEDWLRFVAMNRRSSLAGRLRREMNPSLTEADIVIGKIANDATNRVITTYLNGLYGEVGSVTAERIAIQLLLPNRLKDQLCFRSDAAVGRLELVGVRRYDL